MTKFDCKCDYCGERWTTHYSYAMQECSKCGDKNVRVKRIETVDYYNDKPEIKEKIREHAED